MEEIATELTRLRDLITKFQGRRAREVERRDSAMTAMQIYDDVITELVDAKIRAEQQKITGGK